MAISTYMVFLMEKSDGENWKKVIDIKDFPDLGGEPELIDVTTLSHKMQTYINGIQSSDGLQFGANYDRAEFKALKKLEGETKTYAVWFGGSESGGVVTPDGHDGKFTFDGQLSVYVTGGGVNEAVGMSISIAPSTPIEFSEE